MSTEPASIELSFVIPCHNEQDNLRPLAAAIRAVVQPLGRCYEIILADDCSTDGTWPLVKELAAADARIRGLRFAKTPAKARRCGPE